MDPLGSADTGKLFTSAMAQQQQLEYLASNSLKSGMDLYRAKDYEGASRAFKGALSMAPTASFSKDAAKYLAMSELQMGHTDKAVDAYKRSIKLNPESDEPHVDLAKLYFSRGMYREAEAEYEAAVRIQPSSVNRYSLGQAYLFRERYQEAEAEFREVRRLEPDSPYGYYGLGLAHSKQGRYDRAIALFEEAASRNREFYDAYAETGFAYADSGQIEEAEKICDFLEDKAPDLADTLSRYIYKVDPPKMDGANPFSTFEYMMPRLTKLSDLDAYLANAGASKTFAMTFQFDKEMDREYIENRYNWNIGRAAGSYGAESYNFGFPVSSTEVSIPRIPDSVYWDEDMMTATVRFTITQNEAGDGTIDPSHIEFKFMGRDKYGLSMDEHADQFTGFSKVF